MRQLVAFLCFLVFLAENVNGTGNDTLEMELESNITVVKLEHGLKFQAHSEFGLPDNMTDLFNSTAADSEGANNSSLADSLEHHRARRSNKDGEIATARKPPETVTVRVMEDTGSIIKKATTTTVKKTTKKVKTTTKKRKVTTKKPQKKTTKKQTTKKSQTTKKQTTKKMTTRATTQLPPRQPATQHKVPDQVYGKLLGFWNEWLQYIKTQTAVQITADKRFPPGPPQEPVTEPNRLPPWTQPIRPGQPTTRRIFVMYEDYELEKKQPNKTKDKDDDFDFDWRSS